MPIHFEDQDVAAEVKGIRSALIVPCNLCPAVTVAVRQKRPFLQLLKSPVKSAPFEEHLAMMRSRLGEMGVRTDVFRSRVYHQWFMCMWTSHRRKKLERKVRDYDAVIVLGCDSAARTVRQVLSPGVRLIEGMRTAGIMNGRIGFRLPANVVFDGCEVVPIAQRKVA